MSATIPRSVRRPRSSDRRRRRLRGCVETIEPGRPRSTSARVRRSTSAAARTSRPARRERVHRERHADGDPGERDQRAVATDDHVRNPPDVARRRIAPMPARAYTPSWTSAPTIGRVRCARPPAGSRSRPAARGSASAATTTTCFSRGYICPKGPALQQLDDDPDRLREPLIRRGGDVAARSTWDEAFAEIERGLPPHPRRARPRRGRRLPRQPVRAQPAARALRAACSCARSARATSTRRAPSTRCRSRCRAGLMFGTALSVPVPDLDRTDYLLDPRRRTRSCRTAA